MSSSASSPAAGPRTRWAQAPTRPHRIRFPGQAGRWRWLAFGVVITAAVMDLLDSTIAQVAAPTIRRELGGSYAVVEWVTAAYALAMAVGLLTGGPLGDVFGRRQGAADREGLVRGGLGRVCRGVERGRAHRSRGPRRAPRRRSCWQVFGMIRDLFEAHEMGKAFGVDGPVMGLSAMLGPIASGGLISANVPARVEDDLPGEGARRARRAGARRPGPARGLAFPSGGVVGDGRIRVAAGTAGPAGRGPGRRGHVRPGLPPGPGSRARVAAWLFGMSARRSPSLAGSPATSAVVSAAAWFRWSSRPCSAGRRTARGVVLARVRRLAGRS